MTSRIIKSADPVRIASSPGPPPHPRRRATHPRDVSIAIPTDDGHHRQKPHPVPGGKNGPGIYQRIISQMPPHAHYLEIFAGAGAVIRHKLPAPGRNIAIEIDPHTAAALKLTAPARVLHTNAFTFLAANASLLSRSDLLIYADPPYPLSTRNHRRYYAHELTDADHARLLDILTAAHCRVMISGYRCPIYNRALKPWRRIDYPVTTRGGTPRIESLWCNFPEPLELHDYRYLGHDFHDRERIRKLISRWARRLSAMPPLERAAILAALTTPPS